MKTSYIEAPNYPDFDFNYHRAIFLGRSISGAGDWQKSATEKLLPYFNILNPRRYNYETFDISQERSQISWEHLMLYKSEIILFYFSWETLAPITLLEYGAWLEQSKNVFWKKIYVAIHPEYKRKNDVVIQTKLRNPDLSRNIRFDLKESIDLIIQENT